MSVDESYSTPDILNNGPISPGSLVEIGRIKVASEEEINDTSFTESYLNLSSHDKAIAKKVFAEVFSKAVATYEPGKVIPLEMQELLREE